MSLCTTSTVRWSRWFSAKARDGLPTYAIKEKLRVARPQPTRGRGFELPKLIIPLTHLLT